MIANYIPKIMYGDSEGWIHNFKEEGAQRTLYSKLKLLTPSFVGLELLLACYLHPSNIIVHAGINVHEMSSQLGFKSDSLVTASPFVYLPLPCL